ncbi:MAG: phosphatidylserine decarboxylase family protein [Bacteroidetes bacterium]|nr:phosphatidylserine decarboxylase family protein [Bacteroidota bacterium]
MSIHREGFRIILTATLLLGLLNFGIHSWLGEGIVFSLILAASLIFYILIVQFFRNPTRVTPISNQHIIAPADGKVVVIEEVEEPEYFKDKRRQISIFMSPLNVHVNRYPISGKVAYQKYYPGKYLVAWHPKSSTENERTTVVVQGEKGAVLFRQIAGAVARRIICYSKESAAATQGNEFGFIRFGSRVDIFVPLDCQVNVKLGEKTVGGETILAVYP